MNRKLKLKEVCREITVGHVGPMADEYVESGIPFLRSQNVAPFRLNESNIKFISEDFHRRLKKSALSPGDVVVVRTGYPGTACVIPERLKVANCADLVIIRPSRDIDSHYLCCLFNSTWGRGTVAGSLVGVAQQHFISEQQFFDELSKVSPAAVELAKWAIAEAPRHHLIVDWGTEGPMLKYQDEGTGQELNFGRLCKSGEFDPQSLLGKFRRLHLPEDIATDYLDDVTHLVPGSYRSPWPWSKEIKTEVIFYPEGFEELLPIAKLATHKEKWFEAIDKAIGRLRGLSS